MTPAQKAALLELVKKLVPDDPPDADPVSRSAREATHKLNLRKIRAGRWVKRFPGRDLHQNQKARLNWAIWLRRVFDLPINDPFVGPALKEEVCRAIDEGDWRVFGRLHKALTRTDDGEGEISLCDAYLVTHWAKPGKSHPPLSELSPKERLRAIEENLGEAKTSINEETLKKTITRLGLKASRRKRRPGD